MNVISKTLNFTLTFFLIKRDCLEPYLELFNDGTPVLYFYVFSYFLFTIWSNGLMIRPDFGIPGLFINVHKPLNVLSVHNGKQWLNGLKLLCIHEVGQVGSSLQKRKGRRLNKYDFSDRWKITNKNQITNCLTWSGCVIPYFDIIVNGAHTLL